MHIDKQSTGIRLTIADIGHILLEHQPYSRIEGTSAMINKICDICVVLCCARSSFESVSGSMKETGNITKRWSSEVIRLK